MFARTALTGLLVAAVIAICPALAQAVLTPTLTLEQGAGTTAGTSPATGFNINFNPRLGVDSVKNLTIAFPPGFLLNLGMNGGECVTATAPNPLCVLGTGTINSTKGVATPVTLYLVAPPTLANLAGIAFVIQGGATITGPVSPSPPPRRRGRCPSSASRSGSKQCSSRLRARGCRRRAAPAER